jgi:hypothetical protein
LRATIAGVVVWGALGRGLALGGALLVASTLWLYGTVGVRATSSFPLTIVGAAGVTGVVVALVVARAHDVELVAPTHSSGFCGRVLPWCAVAVCLGVAGLAWREWPAGGPGVAVGPAWPATLVGSVVAGAGFLLLTRPVARSAPVTAVAAVVAVAVPVTTLVPLAPWVRGHADHSRVSSAPLADVEVTGTPVHRWEVYYRGVVLGGATVPVVYSDTEVRGLDPMAGGVRWLLRHDDRVPAWAQVDTDRMVVTWYVHRTSRGQGQKTLRGLVDTTSGRVLAETADERRTFVGDRTVVIPPGCRPAAGAVASGLLTCGSRVERIDATGRLLWAAEAVPDTVAHFGPDGLLLASRRGTVSLDPGSGRVLWRDDRPMDDLVGVTEGVAVRRDAEPGRLSAVDLRTGAPLWTRDTGLQAWSSPVQRVRDVGAAAHHGFLDVVHAGADGRAALTRLSARDGTPTGPGLALDPGDARRVTAEAAGPVLLVDTGQYDFRLFGIG